MDTQEMRPSQFRRSIAVSGALVALMIALVALLAHADPTPSPPPDAAKGRRGLVNVAAEQVFGGYKVFDGGVTVQGALVVDGGIKGNVVGGSSLNGVPFCSTIPDGPGAVLTYTDAGQWCAVGGWAAVEFAPRSGAGMPADAGCYPSTSIAGTRNEPLTFTRTGVAEVYSNDAQSLTQCADSQVRVSSLVTTSSVLGIWVEGIGSTNLLPRGRDASQAVWTKTNMTCTRTANGMRGGDANGATTCTATGANATVTQAIVAGSAPYNGSVHIKRRAGTSAISVTIDSSTYTSITSSVSSSTWKRVVSIDAPGCSGGACIVVPAMTKTAANPTIGIKLANSGDAVDIDFAQIESGTVPTSPIDTGATSATRNAETAYVTHPALSVRSMSIVVQRPAENLDFPMQDWADASNMVDILVNSGPMFGTCRSILAGVTASQSSTWYYPYGSIGTSIGCSFGPGASDMAHYIRGVQGNASAGNTPPATSRLYLNSESTGVYRSWGGVKMARLDGSMSGGLWTGAATGSPLAAWVGDSITSGIVSSTKPPAVLSQLSGVYAQNFGTVGDTAAQCLARWRSSVRGKGYTTLILLCGVNSIIGGIGPAGTLATLQTIMDEARADGLKVIPVGLTPWATFGGWNASMGTDTIAVNAGLSAYAATYGLTYVSTDSLGTGSPLALSAGYDSGDHIHPNNAGSQALAALVQAANP